MIKVKKQTWQLQICMTKEENGRWHRGNNNSGSLCTVVAYDLVKVSQVLKLYSYIRRDDIRSVLSGGQRRSECYELLGME